MRVLELPELNMEPWSALKAYMDERPGLRIAIGMDLSENVGGILFSATNIIDIMVPGDYRRGGFGKALVEYAIRQGVDRAIVDPLNKEAVCFFTSCGFVVTGFSDGNLYMATKLTTTPIDYFKEARPVFRSMLAHVIPIEVVPTRLKVK